MANAPVVPKEVSFEDLTRDTSGSLQGVDEQAVRVVRDSGRQDDLLVMRADHARRNVELLDVLIGLLEASIEQGQDSAWESLPDLLPWSTVLPEDDRKLMASEILKVASYKDPSTRVETLDILVGQWEDTAAIWQDEGLLERLRAPVGNFGPVAC